MPRGFRLTVALLLASGMAVPQRSQEPLVRVNVDLVQIDVIVSDSHGNHVADLKPGEFEILDDGKPQPITNFSYIAGDAVGGTITAVAPGASPRHDTIAPARLTPERVTRSIAIVVDDLGMGEQSFAALHPALERFVERQVQPGDLVALITTSGSLGALDRVTADHRVLRAALAKLRSIPNHRTGIFDDDFTCLWFNHRRTPMRVAETLDEDAWLSLNDGQRELENDHRADYYSRLSISALRRVVDGMRELPGRKSILLFSEGMALLRGQGLGETNQLLIEAYNAFLDHANRSAVAVNTIDPRGLLPTSSRADSRGDQCQEARDTELVNTQQLLIEMARKTGGIAFINDNDLSGAIGRVLGDQTGYYLIGYKPPATWAKELPGIPRFRKISVRVTRPGLKVRFHSSLYETDAPANNARDRLSAAVHSPFTLSDIHARIASRYWDAGPGTGTVLDTAFEMDAHDLTFRMEPDGRRKAEFEIVALIYGGASKPLATFQKTYAVLLTPPSFERALTEGLVQRLELPVKSAGAYQIRGAVRDRQADRIGSASEFLEVPYLRHGALALSGIALSGSAGADTLLRYRPGQQVFFAYQILNARPDRESAIQVEVTASLLKDGHALGTSAPRTITAKDQPDLKRLVVTDDLRLGKQLPPGDYTLQISALDKNAPAKRATAVQSIDFKVVN